MSAVLSISGRRRYGLCRVCRVWGVARAGIYRRRRAANLPTPPRRRPGPQGPMPDAALVAEIHAVLAASPFHGEGYRKVWARLRHKGVRTSKERVRRLMRAHDLSADTGRATPRGPRNHDGAIIPETVDAMWGTDMTAAVTTEQGQVAVFVAVDRCSAECVGIHAALHGTRFEALEPVRQGVKNRFGAIGEDVATRLSLRHDHRSQLRCVGAPQPVMASYQQLPDVLWARIHRHGCPRLDLRGGGRDGIHRTGQPLGEWILRKLRLEATRRAAEWGDLLLSRRGLRRYRSVARPL